MTDDVEKRSKATSITNADDDNWIPFVDYCAERAARSDNVLCLQEAERLALEEVRTRVLQVRWRDADGRQQIELPTGLFFNVGYDSFAACLREQLPGGRAFYQPEVRNRRRNPHKSANEAVVPVVASGGPIEHDESVKPDEAGGNGELAGHGEGLAELGERDECNKSIKPDEIGGHDELADHDEELAESDDPGRHDEGDEPLAADQWPWQQNPAVRADDGSELRRIQQECEQRLKPSVQHLSPAKIQSELEKAGVTDTSESSVRRAFGRK
jgi:hypothetical protein